MAAGMTFVHGHARTADPKGKVMTAPAKKTAKKATKAAVKAAVPTALTMPVGAHKAGRPKATPPNQATIKLTLEKVTSAGTAKFNGAKDSQMPYPTYVKGLPEGVTEITVTVTW